MNELMNRWLYGHGYVLKRDENMVVRTVRRKQLFPAKKKDPLKIFPRFSREKRKFSLRWGGKWGRGISYI